MSDEQNLDPADPDPSQAPAPPPPPPAMSPAAALPGDVNVPATAPRVAHASASTVTAGPETETVQAVDARTGELLASLARALGANERLSLAHALSSPVYREAVELDTTAAGGLPTPESLSALAGDVQQLTARYNDRVFKFGIVGFQSSGKSYLISALFNEENFLPSLDEATTSVVTRIRYPEPGEDASRIRLCFADLTAKEEFRAFVTWLNEGERSHDPIRLEEVPGKNELIADYEQKMFFLKCENPGRDLPRYRLIDEVHILRASEFLTDYTEIIDLPGLGGPYALLDETTMGYLEEVDAVLFITPVNHNWVAKDTEVFRAFAHRPNVFKKTFFVLSKLDSPGSPVAKSVRTFHTLLSEFVSRDVRNDRVFYVSAWMHLFDRLSNAAQRMNLEGVAQAFASQDPASFFMVDDPDLAHRLTHTLAPRDGGILELRDALYRFFTTHKRLLQLNEVLLALDASLAPHRDRLALAMDRLGRHTGNGGDALEREVAWLRKRLEQLVDRALPEFADALAEAPPVPRYTPSCEHALLRRIEALPDARNRREASVVVGDHGPTIARELTSLMAAPWASELAARTRPAFDRQVTGYLESFPPELRAALQAPFAQWRVLCHVAASAVLGSRVLEACTPAASAIAEMTPLQERYFQHVADAVPHAAERAGREVAGALIAAWDALKLGLTDAFDAAIPDFYRQFPDAPRPLVDSPESVRAHLEPLARAVDGALLGVRALDGTVRAWLEGV